MLEAQSQIQSSKQENKQQLQYTHTENISLPMEIEVRHNNKLHGVNRLEVDENK